MFHKHKWKEIARTYKPAPFSMIGARAVNKGGDWMFEDQTTILWECEICQKLRKEELLGKSITHPL